MARYGSRRYYGGWAPYVPVAQRKAQAAKKMEALKKKGQTISPVQIEGKTIALTFWGKAWCDNLEAYSDFSNRLPRGRTYVRNGSVLDLQIEKNKIRALVNGSSIYKIEITIQPVEKPKWKNLIEQCSGQINSLVELLQGRFSDGVMKLMTHKENGLFPSPKQISMKCSCPDSAVMCKHVAAVLYGIGARLDNQPELFFELRNVDHSELTAAVISSNTVKQATQSSKILKTAQLSSLFGIDIEGDSSVPKPKPKSTPTFLTNKPTHLTKRSPGRVGAPTAGTLRKKKVEKTSDIKDVKKSR